MRNFATAAPDGVKRSSGSSTRLPTRVMTVSPAMVVIDLSVGAVPFKQCSPHRPYGRPGSAVLHG